jgi:hypothetical protein
VRILYATPRWRRPRSERAGPAGDGRPLAGRRRLNGIIDQHTNLGREGRGRRGEERGPAVGHARRSKQAEAERERRAKIINAEGEAQAAEKLAQAADVLARTPIAVQLRFLQTMREVASERNTTTFFPIPIDLFAPFLKTLQGAGAPKP